MPPKKVYIQSAGARRQPKGFFASTYDTLTSPENSAMVKAIASFGVSLACPPPRLSHHQISSSNWNADYFLTLQVGVTFLASSWGEFLLPP